MKRLGILGGTFDPIHLGHLILASFAADEMGIETVLFMPARTPPHKIGHPVSREDHRVAMLQLAIENDARFAVSGMDLTGGRPSYTADLLARMSVAEPDVELTFLIGADSLRDFPSWHAPERILESARLGVAHRPGTVIDDRTLGALPGLRERVTIFPSPLIDISSTEIRRRVAARKRISWLVPRGVEQYILDQGLYLPSAAHR